MFWCGFTTYNCFCYLDCPALDLGWKVLPYFPFLLIVWQKQVVQCCQLLFNYTFLDFKNLFLFVFPFFPPQLNFILETTCHLISLLLVSIIHGLWLHYLSIQHLVCILTNRKLLCKTWHEHKPVRCIFVVGNCRGEDRTVPGRS